MTTPTASTSQEPRPVLLLAVNAADVERFSSSRFVRLTAQTTADALRAIATARPRVVALDLDSADFDAIAICAAAHQTGCTSVLAMTTAPERAPAAIKAGCHALLLKPFSPAILASRLGRLVRDPLPNAAARRAAAIAHHQGTNRTWPDAVCPKCGQAGAVSFEFSSYRRMWYACLPCESVWLGPRRE